MGKCVRLGPWRPDGLQVWVLCEGDVWRAWCRELDASAVGASLSEAVDRLWKVYAEAYAYTRECLARIVALKEV